MRIRSIKPEFWSSPNLPADPWSRLLYIAMWNWADDNGVGTANPRELLGFAFPNDDHLTTDDLRRMLVEIRRVFGVVFYTVAGRPYYSIPSWEKHQKFDRRSKGKHPNPDGAEEWLYLRECTDSAESHESPPNTRRDSVAGTGEQGNRGTGEQGKKQPSSAELTVRPTKYPPEFETFWAVYPRKVGKDAALKVWQQAKRRATTAEIQQGVERLAADPNLPEQNYIPHAATWLKRGGWDDAPYPPTRNGSSRTPTADARVIDGLDLARRLAAEEAATEQANYRTEIEA